MAVSLEKKERTVKGDQYDPAKDSPTVKLVFLSRTQEWKIINGSGLPSVDGICFFYRELGMGLLVWIHHHRG